MKRLFLFLLVLFLLIPSISALSVSGQRLSPIIFEPGKVIENHYIISETSKEVKVSLAGEMSEYARVTEVVNGVFDLIIEVPEDLPPPGSYKFIMQVVEISDPSDQIGSNIGTTMIFFVEVPPHGKTLQLSLDIGDVNGGESLEFRVNLLSKGLIDIISLKGEVSVIGPGGKEVGSLPIPEGRLEALGERKHVLNMDSNGLSPGLYRALAVVDYDGETAKAEKSFKIGSLDVKVINYTNTLTKGFTKFKTTVESNWANPISTFYLKLFVNGKEYLQTPTVSLKPWEKKDFESIIDMDLDFGKYEGVIKLFFEDQSTEQEIKINVAEAVVEAQLEEPSKTSPLLYVLVLVGVLLVIGWLVYTKTKKK